MTSLRRTIRSQDGATATEYIFLLVFIAIAIIVGAQALGGALNSGFIDASRSVANNTGTGGGDTDNTDNADGTDTTGSPDA